MSVALSRSRELVELVPPPRPLELSPLCWGAIYLLHFDRPIGNVSNPRAMAQHYVGWAIDPHERERLHKSGAGARLTRAAVEQGVSWTMYILTWGTRDDERAIKLLKATPQLCPVCGVAHPKGRRYLSQRHQQQLAIGAGFAQQQSLDDFDSVPQPKRRDAFDWIEISYMRARHRAQPVQQSLLALVDDWRADEIAF